MNGSPHTASAIYASHRSAVGWRIKKGGTVKFILHCWGGGGGGKSFTQIFHLNSNLKISFEKCGKMLYTLYYVTCILSILGCHSDQRVSHLGMYIKQMGFRRLSTVKVNPPFPKACSCVVSQLMGFRMLNWYM